MEPIGQIAESLTQLSQNISPASNPLFAIIAAPILTALSALIATYIYNRISYWHQKRERRRMLAAAMGAELEGWRTICEARDYDAYGQSLITALSNGTDIQMPRLVDERLSPLQTASANFPIINRNIDDIGVFGNEITSELAQFLSLHQGLTADLISYALGKWDHASVPMKLESIQANLGIYRKCVQLAKELIPKLQLIAYQR